MANHEAPTATEAATSPETQTFTVIGFYTDTKQRFAGDYDAVSGDEAEQIAVEEHSTLVVCGVAAGEIKMVDSSPEVDL